MIKPFYCNPLFKFFPANNIPQGALVLILGFVSISSLRWSNKIMTSKPDNPPPYEDALHHPKYDDCPQQSQPPPPSYTSIPGTYPGPPGYWGQAGPWAGPVISPGGGPATVPTLSAGVPAANTGCEEKLQDSVPAQCNQMTELVGISQLQETWRMFCAASGRARLFATPSSER